MTRAHSVPAVPVPVPKSATLKSAAGIPVSAWGIQLAGEAKLTPSLESANVFVVGAGGSFGFGLLSRLLFAFGERWLLVLKAPLTASSTIAIAISAPAAITAIRALDRGLAGACVD